MPNINKQVFKRFLRLIKPFFFSEVKWYARGLFLVLILFALSIAGINFGLNYLYSYWWTALSLREQDIFFKQLAIYLVALACATPVSVLYKYTEDRLSLLWRKWLSRRIIHKYFSNLAFYKLLYNESIDNPDQRIEEDVRFFVQNSLSLFLIFLNSVLALISFTWILWSISINLIIGVLVYALVGTLITFIIGRSLIGLNFAQLKKEADFRYKLVNIRDHAESIAFYRGGKKEQVRVRQRLKKALDNFLQIVNVSRNISFFVTFYNNFKPVLPIIIVAPLLFDRNNNFEFGKVPQAADAFIRVVEALSILIQNFATISSLTAVVTRLGSFIEVLDEEQQQARSTSGIQVETGQEVSFQDVTIYTPKSRQLLVKDLNFKLSPAGLLITGASGNGKTSVFRALAGLWNSGSGKIIRPELEKILFLPQRPYLVLGSLRNQLLYTIQNPGHISDKEMINILYQVGFKTLLQRVSGLDAYANWNSLLSAGEQQQLAFARLLLTSPQYAFLDEATTAVDAATEKRLYQLLKEKNISFVSIGDPNRLAQFHQDILELKGNGEWSMEVAK